MTPAPITCRDVSDAYWRGIERARKGPGAITFANVSRDMRELLKGRVSEATDARLAALEQERRAG